MDRESLIEIENVTKVYDLGEQRVDALRGVSLHIYAGEIIALMGPSGSGKSTLMNILGCLDQPTTGRFQFLGKEVGGLTQDERAFLRNHEIGFVFQNYNLLARTSALENVELPMLYNGASPQARQGKAKEMLERVGLQDREDHQPTQLSGGQQQRVAIARALLNEPRLILADEPTGNLDSKTGAEIIELFKEVNREKGITLVLVTHDPDVASHSHRIIHFKDGLIQREEQRSESSHAPIAEAQRQSATEKRSFGSDISANIRIALKALWVNKLRSALTMLGVIIGVGAVIAMVAIGQGTKMKIAKQMERLGSNRLSVYSGSFTRGGRHAGMGSITSLTPADVKAILAEVPGVRAAAPRVRGSAQVVYGNKNWLPVFTGTTPEYLSIMNWGIEMGSNFSEEDMTLNRKVVLIGKTVEKELFDGQYPIGQTVRIKHVPFEVVGVLKERGSSSRGSDLDDIVIIPLRTAQRKLLGIRHVQRIEISAVSRGASYQVQKDIAELLRRRHKISGAKLDDFRIRNRTEIVEAANEATNTLSYLLTGIALVALIVGGIGIMNIMLVSVTERTREIGIRMAVGARPRDIRKQFLAEAMVLSLFGGFLGIIVGMGASYALSYFGGWETMVSPGAVLLACGVSVAIGVFFGFHPAEQAAKLNPIEALRYE
ncbi:MAG: ABC transporter permease [Deltaproteobacteria bacterium]|nr:ABC transporter permease [Deltaproteobacteria bacterium]